jgi:outer membrane receptor protein involved in Fe transport
MSATGELPRESGEASLVAREAVQCSGITAFSGSFAILYLAAHNPGAVRASWARAAAPPTSSEAVTRRFLSQCLRGSNYSRTLNDLRAIEDGPAEM